MIWIHIIYDMYTAGAVPLYNVYIYIYIYIYIYVIYPEGPVALACVERLGPGGAAGRGRWAHNGTPNHA